MYKMSLEKLELSIELGSKWWALTFKRTATLNRNVI